MVPPNEQEQGLSQGPDVKDATAGPDVQVAGGDGGGEGIAKVTLDLDDAPFLKEEPKEEPKKEAAPPKESAEKAEPADQPEAPPKKSKKKLIIIAAAVGLLVILAAVYFFFLSGPSEPPPPPPEPPKPEVIVVPSKPQAQQIQPDVVKELEPFIIPHTDAQGKMHFLHCKFSVVSKDPLVNDEVNNKLLALRDAIYFYLSSKDTAYLTDAANAPNIKKELRGVVNDYLVRSKLEDVLLDSYLNE